MDFNHNEQQQMLIDSLGRYLAQNYGIEQRHAISGSAQGWSRDQWSTLAELGIVGALFRETSGGYGGGGFDIAVIFEQLGKALVVEPFLGALMAGRILAASGSQQPLIDQLIAGRAIVTLAHEEADGGHDHRFVETTAKRDGDLWRLTGRKAVIAQLAASSHILVSARSGNEEHDIALFLVDAAATGVAIIDYPLIDGGHGGDLLLDDAPAQLIAADALPLIDDAVAAGIVALSWEAVAIMELLRDRTAEYLRTRQQFGTPIGRFQALRHRLANLAIDIEQARSAAINAANRLDADPLERDRMACAAKYTVGASGRMVAEEAIQLHGGIGMTWEMPLSHYAKRLIMIDHQLGDEDHHLARFMALSTTT